MSARSNGSNSIPMSLQGLLYKAMSEMSKYDIQMMKQQLQYMIQSARAYGGWSQNGKTLDASKGIIGQFLAFSQSSAEQAGAAIEDEAIGGMVSAGLGLLGAGATVYTGFYSDGPDALKTQSEDAATFKETINGSLEDPTFELSASDSETIAEKQTTIQEKEDSIATIQTEAEANAKVVQEKIQANQNQIDSLDEDSDAEEIAHLRDANTVIEKQGRIDNQEFSSEIAGIRKQIHAKQAEIGQKQEEGRIEQRISAWTAKEPELGNFKEDAAFNKTALSHLKQNDPVAFKTLQEAVNKRADELGLSYSGKTDSSRTAKSGVATQFSQMGSNGAQAAGHIPQAAAQEQSGEDKALADVEQTVQQQWDSQLNATQQKADAFLQDANAIAAGYAQMSQTRG